MPFHTLARSRYSPALLARVAQGWRRIAETNGAAWRAPPTSRRISRPWARRRPCWPPPRGSSPTRFIIWMCAPACSTSWNRRRAAAPSRARRRAVSIWCRAPPVGKRAGPHAGGRLRARQAVLGGRLRGGARHQPRTAVRLGAPELLHAEARHATFGAKTAAWVIRRWSARQRRALWAQALPPARPPRAGAPTTKRRSRWVSAGQLGLHVATLDPAAPGAAGNAARRVPGQRARLQPTRLASFTETRHRPLSASANSAARPDP